MQTFDLIVIGAGIVGAAVAREAARAGLRTLVLEARVPGGGVTAAGMGHVVVMDDSPAQLALTAYSRQLWLAEADSLPASVEYQSRGTIWVAADDEEMGEVHAKHRTYAQTGVQSQVLSATELAAEEPNLRPSLAGGLLVPDDGICYPPAAAHTFLSQAVAMGAQHTVARVRTAGKGLIRLEDGTEFGAGTVVLATGADLSLLPGMPIAPRKGHLVITDRYPTFARHQLVELGYSKSAHGSSNESVAFNIQPRRTGQMLIGSSRQFGSTSSDAEPGILAKMLRRAAEYMPAIEQLSAVRIWTGFRAATPDKLPLIGPAAPLSDDPSLWLATGFEGLGITNAPGAARLLVDQLTGAAPALDPTPFLPARLSVPHVEAAYA